MPIPKSISTDFVENNFLRELMYELRFNLSRMLSCRLFSDHSKIVNQ
jgi:hypothetical protein